MGDLADRLGFGPLPDGAAAPTSSNVTAEVRYSPGWEPRVTHGDDEGEAVSEATTAHDADEADLIRGWGLDPAAWQIIPGSLTVNKWQQRTKLDPAPVWLYQYKARLRRRVASVLGDDPDVGKIIARWKPRKNVTDGDHAFVVCLADWQAGKGEGGGTEALVARVMSAIDATETQLALVRKSVQVGHIVIAGLGDLVEQCSGNYPGQAFTVDLNRREQMRVARRLLAAAVSRLARLAPRCTVATVGGNHGENRQDGKAFTDPGDNDDVAVFESLAEQFCDRQGFEHIEWVIPDDDLAVLVDCAGVPVGFTHGHLARKGTTPAQKQIGWWTGQTMGGHVVADARVLVTGHYHHFAAEQTFGKMWLQCPALDGGSRWFTDSTGQHSPAGTLTFVAGPSADWSHVQIV